MEPILLYLRQINLTEEIYYSLNIGNKLCVDLGLQFHGMSAVYGVHVYIV